MKKSMQPSELDLSLNACAFPYQLGDLLLSISASSLISEMGCLHTSPGAAEDQMCPWGY